MRGWPGRRNIIGKKRGAVVKWRLTLRTLLRRQAFSTSHGNTTIWRKRRKPKSDSFKLLRPLEGSAVPTVEPRNEPIDVPNFTACI
jgi:hypothetical protein